MRLVPLSLILAALLAAACRDYGYDDDPDARMAPAPDAPISSGGTPDARAPVDVDAPIVIPADARTLDAPAASGIDAPLPQSGVVPAIGGPGTVDIVCWNVRQFPATTRTPKSLADLLTSLDVDVAALAEIDDDVAFAELLRLLPGWEGHIGGGDGYIKMALVWRSATVTVTGAASIFDFDYDFPRPPLVATVSRGGAPITLVNVHLKAGRSNEDAARRKNANTKIAGWLAGRGHPAALVCGDFNEDMDNAYAPEVYSAYLAAPQTYRLLTAALDHADATTFLPATGVMFDQMISTAALDGVLLRETPFIPPLDRQYPSYETVISDHLPVAIRLALP